MNSRNISIAESYYHHMLAGDFNGMSAHLAQDVAFISPLSELSGKEAVTEAAKGLKRVLNQIVMRTKLADNHQVMLAYDFFFEDPIGKLRAAVLMDFNDDLITRIELFFDARPFITS